ncbi:hypothetical protein C4573_02720 [Candidatus Woesearchaeota archaeon]|nr:MAG: hypothetical protein C4573_02720 [Candidatus Woesearchaeota archaeon]
MKDIETGVDKLVSLVNKYDKVSLDEAAKELGVSTIVVQEWADFLEEQGVITVEYSLSKVWLKPKKLTKTEVATKVKEYDTKKESFIRKVETSMKSLEKESEWFDNVKNEFSGLKTGIGADMDKVEKELEELKKFQDLKSKIDEDIARQKLEYKKIIDASHEQVDVEEKRFREVLKGIKAEEQKIALQKKEMQSLEENEQVLKQRFNALTSIIETIRKKIDVEESAMKESNKMLDELEEYAQKIEKDIEERKSRKIAPLMQLSNEQQQKINDIQEKIVKKVEETKTKIEKDEAAAREVALKFKKFFERKAEVDKLIQQIDADRNGLKTEMDFLLKKATAFDLISKNADIKGYVGDLEKKFTDLDKKRFVFKKELEKLTSLIHE